MAELKTKKTAASVEAFLNAVANEKQRADAFVLVKMMREITGEEPYMFGPTIVCFGDYHYVYETGHEGDCGIAAFSPRKGNLVVYLMGGFAEAFPALLKKLGKCKASVCCLYIRKLADVDLAVLRELIVANIARLPEMNKPKAKAAPAKKARKKG